MGPKEGINDMLKILLAIYSRPESEAFREPVNWKALELFDYPEIVKSPMDLGTIKRGIEAGKYETVDEIAHDIRLVWSNCMLYNRDGSEFYHLANSYATAFEESFATLKRLHDLKADQNRIPTMPERMQLSHDIFKLDSVELAAVLTLIEKGSPNALSRRVAHDEVLVNIDALRPACFHEVSAFVLEALLTHSGGKKKRKTDSAADGAVSATTSGKDKKKTKG